VHFKGHTMTGASFYWRCKTNRLFKWEYCWLKNFTACEKPCQEDSTLLICSHQCHISILAINTAKESETAVFTLPLCTSYNLQPVDCTIFGP
jgi:hypothetical protein